MLVEEPPHRKVGPTWGQRTKWEKEKKVHLDVVEELQKIQKFEDKPIEVEVLLVDLESTKFFTQLGRLNGEVPLEMTKKVNLPSGHKGSVELTNQYVELTRAGIPARMDTSIGKVDMIGNNHIMSGSDNFTRKVDLMKVSES
jgi:hypothetical protein